MLKSSKARLFSTCLTGAILAASAPAWGQTNDAPVWKPRAEAEAQAGKDIGVSTSLFAPVAQNDSGLVYVDGRIGYDQRFDRNGSATVGARFRTGEDTAIGVNVGADFYRSDIGSRDQAAVSMGLEGFSSVFDVRVNYRLPLSKVQTIGFIDPNATTGAAALVLENNRLIERRSGFRLEAIPLQGFNGEAGVRLPVGDNASIRGSVGGFDYWDRRADESYRGVRGGLELDIEDKDSGARFTFGGVVEHDNRFGTDARAHVRLSIPFGGRAGDRGAAPTGLDRQMGDRVRRDYVARSGSRYSDLTTTRFAVDARTGNQFGGFYYANGAGVTGAAGTLAAPTTIADAVSRAGANGVVVALGNAGTINTAGVTLATDQYLLGGASAVDVRLVDGSTVQYGLGGTNGVVVGTSAAGAAVTLGQGSVIRDVTVRGAGTGIAANGVGGFAIERVIVENTGGAGIALTNTLGNVALTGLTVRGGAGAGVLVNGGSNVSIANSTISGGAGAIDINDGGADLTTALSNLTLSATGGNVLDIDGSGAGTVTVTGLSGITIRGGAGETGGVSVRSAAFDASTATAGIQAVNAGRMEVGTTAARVNGQGVFLTDVTGSLSFTDLDIVNSGATGLYVVNSKVNGFTLATLDGTIDTVGGTAADLDPLVINLTFATVGSAGAAGPGVILNTVQGGGTGGNALTIGTLTVSNSGGGGLVILNSTGLVRINGGTITNSGGNSVQIGEQGVAGSGGTVNLTFAGSITDSSGAAPIVAIFNAAGTINFTGPISGSGGIVVQDTLAGSAISFGAITLTGTAGDAIVLDRLAGSINFAGLVTIANPGANGIVIGTVPGGVTFGDVDITGLGNFNGVDVRNTHGTVLFNTLDITGDGSGTGTGINVTGSTNAGNVMTIAGSAIQGVAIGVDLTQANMTGQFRFGDGSATPMNSTISAAIPIVIALMNASNGSYNFADANLVGDTTNLTGAGFTAYYAAVGATGAGTRNDPGSLAGADASTAQYIVLLNNPAGGQDVFDAASAGGSFDLAAGQSLVSFLNGDFFAVTGAGMPANLTVSGVGPAGITNVYAGSGAAVLTTSTAGAATINLASNSAIDGLVIRNAGGDVGVEGSGVSNVRIQNSDIAGATGAIAISDGGATSSVQLTHLDLASASGTTLALSGAGAGTLTVSGADIDIAATGTSAALALTDVTSGGLGFGSVSTATSATGAVAVQNVTGGNLVFGSIAVGGTTVGEGVSISDSSSAISVQSISVSGSAADAVRLVNNSGAINIGAISASGAGGDGVQLTGNGAVTIGNLTVSGAGNTGLAIENSLGAVTIGGGAISGVGGVGVGVDGVATGGAVTIGALSISGTSTLGISLADVDGSVTFTGTTNISGVGTSGILLGAASTGTISFGDVNISGLGAGRTGVMARAASGTISFNTLDITGSSTTGTRGIDLTGATFAGSITTVESGSITGVGIGVDLTNAAITGSFRDGDGSSTDADGAASTISALIPIEITGLNGAVGTYNFADVALTGDTSRLVTSATTYFVAAGAAGVGTMANPGSLSGAEASGAQIIVLLNNPAGGQDVLDAASAGGSFDLASGQQLFGFLNGDTLTLPAGGPANLILYGLTPGLITNPFAGSGAPILTTSVAAANTVTLGGSNTLAGIVVQTGAAGGAGVFGSGVANIVIRDSDISGQGGAIHLIDNGAAASVALSGLRLASSGGIVVNLDGSGAGTLAVTALNDITIAGGNGETGGFSANEVLFDADLAAAGAQTVTGTVAVGAAGARVDGVGFSLFGDGSLDLTSLNVVNANDVGVALIGNGALTAIVGGGTIDTLGNTALAGQNAALTLNFGSITATDGGIFMIGSTAADAGMPVLNVGSLDLTDGGLILSGSGDYVFANATITDTVGVAVLFGDQVNLDYAGDITSGTGASATVVAFGHTGTASFHDGTIDVTDGDGFQFIDADGTYSFTGTATLHGGDAGINVANDSSGNFFFGAGTSVANGAVAGFVLQNSNANVTYLGSLTQGLTTDNFVVSGQTGGVLDFSQATISASAGSGVLFLDADGTTMLGDVQLSGGAGIAIVGGSAGAISFGNVDITGVSAGQTAVDLTGATGNVSFQTLDISGTGGTGIDLSGSTTAANIIVSESSSITGLGIGVDLTTAAITGTFRFGDGSNADADGAASTINAAVPIEIAGLNGAVGTYNFADVTLTGDTSRLVTSATTYFVAAGAAGAGTMADPGSLSGAEASGAQIIILLNDPAGGQDTLDAASAGGAFDLFAGQQLLGFLNGDTLMLPAGGPSNLILFGLTPGQIVNPFTGSGAPLLTNSGAGNTLNLASNTLVDGVVVDASNGSGIVAVQAANVTIRNSIVSGSQSAIRLSDGAANASAALSNLQLTGHNGAVLDLDGTNVGTLTITTLDNITVRGGNGEFFGIRGNGVTFDADLAAAGFQTVMGSLQVGTAAARIGGFGVILENSEGAADFAVDIATDGGAGLSVTGGAGGMRLGTSGGTIDAINAAGSYGLYLRDLSSFVALDSISLTGGTGVGIQNVTGVGAGGNALIVDNLTVAAGAAGAITMTGSATGSFLFGQSSSIGTTTGSAIVLSNSGASSFTYSGDVDFAGANAVLNVSGGHSGSVTFDLGTLTATSGLGLVFDNADGTYDFSSNADLAAGIAIRNGSSGTFTFTNMAITNPSASALDVRDSTASVSYSGAITYSAPVTPAVYVANHAVGTIAFGAGSLTTTGGNGLSFVNADGTYSFANTIDIDASVVGIAIGGGSSGTFDFSSAASVVTAGGAAIDVSSSTASIDYRGYAYASGGNGIKVSDHSIGTIDLSAATLALNGGTIVRFDNADGVYDFGSFATAGGSGVAILNGSAGAFTFGDVDIADLGAGQTGVNLTGATGNVSFQTLDISGTGGTGIDLSGSTTAANIIVSESSSITGLGIGVDLTNAAITGTFRYGDGSSTDADGAASTISAVTPLVITGLNAGGTYDFRDVVLTGDTSTLQTSSTIFWVQAGAAGTGTRSDPGSLAAAEASGADVILLLDTQGAGQDVIDGASAGGGLDLAANQRLLGFLNGDTVTVGGGAPANLLLFGIAGGTVTNPYAGSGAPLLTTTQAGANTVTVASGSVIDGVQIGNLDAKGVFGQGVTGVAIRNSTIFGSVNAIQIIDGGVAADVALSNLTLNASTGAVLSLIGTGGGQLSVTALNNLVINGGSAGVDAQTVTFDANLATGGIQTVAGSLSIGGTARPQDGLSLSQASGALSLALDVRNDQGVGVFASGTPGFAFALTGGTIDTINGTLTSKALMLDGISADVTLSSIGYAGLDIAVLLNNVAGIGAGGRTLDVTTLTVAGGATMGVSVNGTTGGNIGFGAGSSITALGGVQLVNTGAGTFTYAGSITSSASALVLAGLGHSGTATFTGSLNATGGTGLQFDNADGTYSFTGTTTLNGGDAGIDIFNGSAGTFTFGTGTAITSPSGTGISIADSTAAVTYSGSMTYATAGQAAIEVVNHSVGTVTFQTGAISATNGTGLQFDNADGTYNFTGTTTLNGGDAGIDIVNGSAGTFTFGAGTAITSPSGTGINIDSSTASLTYSGDLTYATAGQAAVNVANHSVGTVTFQTGTIGATNGTGLQFDNADGTYNFTGTTTLNGGDAGIDIVNGSAGIFTFGAGTAITSPSGTGINIDSSTASLTYSGDL
ncbi:right-handed parallel beta-helix repeat-containing protein, partial [Sphingomonas naasensis]